MVLALVLGILLLVVMPHVYWTITAPMKYSPRSLMIVVALACVVSGFIARSRYCAERAAFHRRQLQFTSREREDLRTNWPHPSPERMARFARLEEQFWFHEEAAIAYERASGMPWLPVSIPTEAP